MLPGVLLALAAGVVDFWGPLMRGSIRLGLGFLGRAIGGRVEVERISGRLLSNPVLEGVRVVFGADSVTAARLEFNYDLPGYLRGELGLNRVSVLEPRVYLSGAAAPADTARRAGGGRFPRLGVRALTVERGALLVGGEPLFDSIVLAMAAVSRPERIRVWLDQARFLFVPESIAVSGMSAAGAVTGDSAVLDSLVLSAPGLRFAGAARVGLADGGVSAAIRELDLSLAEYFDLPGRFRASGRGRLAGGDASADVDYLATGLAWQSLRLPEFTGRLALADSVVRFTLSGSDAELGGVEIDARVRLRTWEYAGRAVLRDVAVRRLEPGLPEFRVSAVAEAGGRGGDSVWCSARARSAELGIDSLSARGVWRPKRVAVERLDLDGPVGRLRAEGAWSGSRGEARLALDSFDLALVGLFAGESIAGRASGRFEASGSADSLNLAGGLQGSGLRVGGVAAAAAAVELDLALGKALWGGAVAGIESLAAGGQVLDAVQVSWQESGFEFRVDLPRNRLLASGRAAVTRDGFDATVSRMEFATDRETLASAGPFRAALAAGVFTLDSFAAEIGGGRIEANGTARPGALPELTLAARHLELARLAELTGLNLDIRGFVDVTAEYNGVPVVELDCQDLVVPEFGVRLRSVAARATLAGDTLGIERLHMVHIDSAGQVDTSRIAGRVVLAPAEEWPVRDVDLAVELNNPGRWALVFLRPTIEATRAVVYGQLRVRGNLIEPDLTGRLRVSRAALRVDPIDATLDRVNGEITMAGRRVNIEKLTGRSRRGTVIADGFVELAPDWFVDTLHLAVGFDGVEASPLKDVYGVASGQVALDWHQPLPIALTGEINVEEALITIDPGAPVVAGGTPDTTLVYDLRVRGERGIWWRSSLADIELAVDVNLKRTLREETYSGVLTSRQGNVYYLDRTLRVTNGTVRFPNINRLNPELDIVAELPLRGNGASGDLPERIVLTVAGTVEAPELSFRSEPPIWDNVEVLSYLNLNATPQQLRDIEGQEAVTRMLSERLLGYFQTRVAKRARGFARLDYLDFESGLVGDARTRLTVGKYIGRNLYVTYTQYFDEQFEPAFRVEYYIDRRNEVVAARDDAGRLSLRYRFKLRY